MLKATKRRQGGYIAPYSATSTNDDYMLYSVPTTPATPAPTPTEIYTPPASTAPGIQGGSNFNKNQLSSDDKLELEDDFLYSFDGGCACNTGGGCARDSLKKGGDFALTPFISALALLGARLLADKNSGFNMNSIFNDNDNQNNYNSNNTPVAGGYYIGSPNARRKSKY